MTTYTHVLDLAKEAEPPAEGILSRPVFQDDRLKAVVFGFGQGQELSEHTAAKPAMLFFVNGEASVDLGDDVQEAQAGTWVHMPAGLKHSIKAKTPVVMLLVYITSPNYIELLWTAPVGRMMLVVSAMWMMTGVFVMKKMINFDF